MSKITKFILLLALSAICSSALAETITESQAREIANSFMATHNMSSGGLRMAQRGPSFSAPAVPQKAAYYIFNGARDQSGYVIVAGDDRVPAVLGYSNSGSFDIDNVSPALQEWLEGYAEQIEALDRGAEAAPLLTIGRAIQPLVPAIWSQNNPYNILLPFVSGKRAVVGCVATAMAQVMYYWKWPARPSGTIPAYTTRTNSIYMPALEPVDFNWDIMQDTYLTNDTTSDAALAAATLSLYCAQAIEMDYRDGASGAYTSQWPLKLSSYFGYKASAHSLCRDNYTNEEWAEAIYSELAAGRPVVYSGSKASSGHAFVCDGYDGNGLFHINWGWNGSDNGYFLLNVLNPDIQGTGSASGSYGYIYRQSAVVGIEPGEGSNEFVLTAKNVSLDSAITTRNSLADDFTFYVSGHFINYTAEVMDVDFGWGLYQGDDLIEVLKGYQGSNLRPDYYYNLKSNNLYFGSNVVRGTYRIVPIYSEPDAGNWRPCNGADKNYIEVQINTYNCTATGYGSASIPLYTVNGVTYSGTMHNGRPVDIDLNVTNNGEWGNRLLYMFVDNTFTATGYVSLEGGETTDIPFRFMPNQAGNYTLTWSWNEDGSDPIYSSTLTITEMPAAELSGTAQALNVTDADNRIITSDKYSVVYTITNVGTTIYDEEVSVILAKHVYDNYGTTSQAVSKRIYLAPGETTTVQFDLDNVIEGWRYFTIAYYYTAGTQKRFASSPFYTIVFPEVPQMVTGDVNGDSLINIKDVTDLINYLLNGYSEIVIPANADVDNDGLINIKDVTELINRLLSGNN